MNMQKKFRSISSVFFLAVSCMVFFSCTDVTEGVFWSIENEHEIPDNSLPNTIGVYGIIKAPAKYKAPREPQEHWDPNGRYYLAGGALFYRDCTPGSRWHQISTPVSGGIVNDVTYIDTGAVATGGIEIYVSVMDGNGGHLYKLNENPSRTMMDPDEPDPLNPVLDPVPDPASTYTSYNPAPVWSGRQIQRLVSIDYDLDGLTDEFFASTGTATHSPYEFLYWDKDKTGVNKLIETGLNGEIMTGGTYDGNAYWFVSRSHVFKISGGWPASPISGPLPPSSSVSGNKPPTTDDWAGAVLWEYDGQFKGSNPENLQDASSFRDIFFDHKGPNGTDPLVFDTITATPPAVITSPTLYVASGNGIFMTNFDNDNDTTRWDVLAGGSYTSLAKITDSITAARLLCGREDSGIIEFEKRDLPSPDNTVHGHYPYGAYGNLPSLYNASITRLLGDGTILIAGTTRSGAWNSDYSSGISSPIWTQE
ncbi:MAG: hypothetical protein LBQ61_06065 [Spirochaetales bacterium]|jgi:hypothetical protein|nr:hypothetical protein [Spirochaetales bacterium]